MKIDDSFWFGLGIAVMCLGIGGCQALFNHSTDRVEIEKQKTEQLRLRLETEYVKNKLMSKEYSNFVYKAKE